MQFHKKTTTSPFKAPCKLNEVIWLRDCGNRQCLPCNLTSSSARFCVFPLFFISADSQQMLYFLNSGVCFQKPQPVITGISSGPTSKQQDGIWELIIHHLADIEEPGKQKKHIPWHKVAIQSLELSLVVNWKGTSRGQNI